MDGGVKSERAFATLTSTGDLSSGFDGPNVYGGLLGETVAKPPIVPTVSVGQPTTLGDLDKAIIRRSVTRNIQKLKYCYEKALVTKSKLAGTVLTKFAIDANGVVAKCEASGVDPLVATCIADVIKGIEFPKPEGGDVVLVTYPFTFRPGN